LRERVLQAAPARGVGQDRTLLGGRVEIFGVELVGLSAESGRKLLLTLAAIALIWGAGTVLGVAARRLLRRDRAFFWARQGVRLATALLIGLAVISIWFDDPARLATGLGLVTAGLAFALQKLITALAGYFVILRGQTFNVGDRISMGGVRGDVIALSFTQTTIMEMGQPPDVQDADPAMWVRSRQYTGRVVTVSNARVFDEPIYNYTREFPYIWEEMRVPIPYRADRAHAEAILLEVARQRTVDAARLGEDALREMERRYFVGASAMRPAVFYRLTDNWLELTVRFIAPTHGVRELKDAMSRDILRRLDECGIGVASATLEVSLAPR
jgi:small-conductance mechanosensitive channel